MTKHLSSETLREPLYPVELLGTPELQLHIPHLPVHDRLAENGTVTIPQGTLDEVFPKLGILVSREYSQRYFMELVQDPREDREIPLPNSLDYKNALTASIGSFVLDTAKRKSMRVEAFSVDGEPIAMSRSHRTVLGFFLEKEALGSAKEKNRRYQEAARTREKAA